MQTGPRPLTTCQPERTRKTVFHPTLCKMLLQTVFRSRLQRHQPRWHASEVELRPRNLATSPRNLVCFCTVYSLQLSLVDRV